MRRWLFVLVALFAVFGAKETLAQCVGPAGVPFSCVPGGPVGANDLILGGQNTNTVAFTATQLATFAAGAGQPGVFSTLNVAGGGTVNGIFFGTATFAGNVTFSNSVSFSSGITLSGVNLVTPTINLPPFPTASLPPVTSLNAGQLAWVSDCANGAQNPGNSTGCLGIVNQAGSWILVASPSNLSITVGGQTLFLTGATANQGNGNRIQLATSGTPGISGQCAQFDASLNIVPSGSGCGSGAGGTGTVSAGLTSQLAYYQTSGSSVTGLAIANNAVLVTNGSGVPSESTTLPSGLTIPSPLITTAATLFGTATSAVQGNGVKIQLSTGSVTSGHCAQFDANGNTADAGGACTTTGASGTVTSSLINQVAYYSAAGTAVVGLAVTNSAVLVTSAGGVPSESTTLPSGITLPSALLTTAVSFFGTSTTATQGTGAKIQLSTGAATNGHCVQFDATGNTIDAGGACTVGGGGGTVSAGTANQLAYYASTGSTVAGLATANNAVLITNGAGLPSESTTLPSSLTIPSALVTTGISLFGTSATAVQGNGVKIQLSSGTTVSGHCAQYDTNGNTIDSGSSCGTGSGTVSSGTINQLAYYAAAGTTLSGLAVVNSAVLVTSAGGVPSESTTLPTGITIPTATLSNATLTGNASVAVMAGTNTWTTAASTTGRTGFNLAPGVAPTSPANYDIWSASNVIFARLNATTLGFAMTTAGGPLTGTSPIAISGSAIACATCATTTNGGALSGTSPIAISAAGAISIGNIDGAAIVQWDSSTAVPAATYFFPAASPWTGTGTIQSLKFITGGTSTPSFTGQILINGVAATCGGATTFTVNTSGASPTCTAGNTFTNGQSITLVTSAISGAPSGAYVQVNFAHPVL